jgi:hypothetical protein
MMVTALTLILGLAGLLAILGAAAALGGADTRETFPSDRRR